MEIIYGQNLVKQREEEKNMEVASLKGLCFNATCDIETKMKIPGCIIH